MSPDVKVFSVAKLGNSSEEYEDACSASSEGRRFSIADGATQTSFADRWSQILSLEFIMNPPRETGLPDRWTQWLEPLQKAWYAGIPWDQLPWYAVEKAKGGACTTLMALEFFEPDDCPFNPETGTSFFKRLFRHKEPPIHYWRAEAFGDSCLFQVRCNRVIRNFPMERSRDFNHTPLLVTTSPEHNLQIVQQLRVQRGTCVAGDLFLLMTDALAKWFLNAVECGQQPWDQLMGLTEDRQFRQFVTEQREQSKMENDDTTLMTIQWPGGESNGK